MQWTLSQSLQLVLHHMVFLHLFIKNNYKLVHVKTFAHIKLRHA